MGRIDSEVAEKSEMISELRTRNGESEKTLTELRWQVSSLEGRMHKMDETMTLINESMYVQDNQFSRKFEKEFFWSGKSTCLK